MFTGSELRGGRIKAWAIASVCIAFLGGLILWYPAPSWTRTEGVTVAPFNAQVRPTIEGFIVSVTAKPGQRVRTGDPLIVAEDAELVARVRLLEAQLKEQKAKLAAAREDRVQYNIIGDEVAHIVARLAYAKKRAGELIIRSPRDGIFIMSQVEDAPGRFFKRGELLAYVMEFSEVAVQVVVPQNEIDLVRKMTRRVELRLVERIPELLPATVKRVVPAATDQLPGMALSSQGGGEVALDPSASGDGGRSGETKAAATMFIFELKLGDSDRIQALGSRIYVRFEQEPEPLATQWYRAARRVLLKKFNV